MQEMNIFMRLLTFFLPPGKLNINLAKRIMITSVVTSYKNKVHVKTIMNHLRET